MQKASRADIQKMKEIRAENQKLLSKIEVEIETTNEKLDEMLESLEENINNLHSQRPETMQVVSESTGRMMMVAKSYPYLNSNSRQ